MATAGSVRLRRTWPQRLLIVFNLCLIAGALYTAWSLDEVSDAVRELPRVELPAGVLVAEAPPYGSPLNFVLVGADSGAGLDPDDPQAIGRPDAELADVIILLRVDPEAQQAWLVSIPRDLEVDIPGHATQRINAAYSLGQEALLITTIKEVFDVSINHFVSVDFAGFASVVDELGGVPVNFPHPASDEGSFLLVPEAGCYRLDGLNALKYVRSRKVFEDRDGDGDYESPVGVSNDLERNQRQQDFLILALERANDRGILGNTRSISETIDAVGQAVVLDNEITPAQLKELAEQFSDFDPSTLTRYSLSVSDVLNARGEEVLRLNDGPENDAILDLFREPKFEGFGVPDGAEPESEASDPTTTTTVPVTVAPTTAQGSAPTTTAAATVTTTTELVMGKPPDGVDCSRRLEEG